MRTFAGGVLSESSLLWRNGTSDFYFAQLTRCYLLTEMDNALYYKLAKFLILCTPEELDYIASSGKLKSDHERIQLFYVRSIRGETDHEEIYPFNSIRYPAYHVRSLCLPLHMAFDSAAHTLGCADSMGGYVLSGPACVPSVFAPDRDLLAHGIDPWSAGPRKVF